MKKFFYATMCVMSLFLSGCGYDDDEVWNAINDQEERIAALEEWQKTANENIAALQAIVNGNDYITSVEEIKEGDEVIGYTTQVSDLDFRQFVHMPVVLPASCCFR